MTHDDFIRDVQRFTAISAVGVSALRRQGVGVIGHIQRYLGTLDLSGLDACLNQTDFGAWLDRTTTETMDGEDGPEVRWGAARKALNLFLRDALYNKYLAGRYDLDHVEHWLEVPLDSIVAQHLKRDAGRGRLPVWPGLKHLTKQQSDQFQNHAAVLAHRNGVARVHLDIGTWLNGRDG